MASQLDIKELTIYKVDVQSICTGCRIEGFQCDSYMFLDYEKAMDFAFNLAKKYVVGYEKLPLGYKTKYYDENEFDINQLVKSESYIFPDYEYDCWDAYSIFVTTSKLEFDKDIINETSFSE